MKAKFFFLTLGLSVGVSLFSVRAFARPEFAVKHGYVNCTVCHESPLGGGLRNLNGKLYGARDYQVGRYSKQEWFQLDSRAEVVQAKSETNTRRGVLLMTTTPSVRVPVLFDEASGAPRAAMVASYGLGLMEVGLKDSYLHYYAADPGENSWLSHVMVGRFLSPFGLANDEHRTYTKVQTKTTVKDYEAGFNFSGDPSYVLHYDLAVTSGLQSGGAALATEYSPWGVISNIRVLPFSGPLLLGASYSVHGTNRTETNAAGPKENPTATAAYGVLSVDRLTKGRIKGSISSEAVWSKGWSGSSINGPINNFIPSGESAWQAALVDSRSFGLMVEAAYDLTNHWTLVYKVDEFIPDTEFTGDTFQRYGSGFRYYFNSNMNLTARYENSFSTRPGITEAGAVPSVSKFVYVLLHVWL